MKINGLNVDTQAIADGLYAIICEREEDAILAFGMIPRWIMDLTENLVRAKVIAEAARQFDLTVAEIQPYVDDRLVAETVTPILHEICVGIYAAAKRAGRMCV